LNAAAKNSARTLAENLKVSKSVIEGTLKLTNPKHIENAIKQIVENTKATEENLRQILGYYGTN